MLFSGEVPYKKLFALVMYARLLLALNMLLAAVATLLRGSDAINSPKDLLTSIGWSQFLPIDNQALRAILDSLGIFNLWYLGVLAVGLGIICRMSRGKAMATVFLYWGLTAVASVGLATFQAVQS